MIAARRALAALRWFFTYKECQQCRHTKPHHYKWCPRQDTP